MLRKLRQHSAINSTIWSPRITFPIRGSFLSNSKRNLQYLLNEIGSNATLTIWGVFEVENKTEMEAAIDNLGKRRVYVDDSSPSLLAKLAHFSLFDYLARKILC